MIARVTVMGLAVEQQLPARKVTAKRVLRRLRGQRCEIRVPRMTAGHLPGAKRAARGGEQRTREKAGQPA